MFERFVLNCIEATEYGDPIRSQRNHDGLRPRDKEESGKRAGNNKGCTSRCGMVTEVRMRPSMLVCRLPGTIAGVERRRERTGARKGGGTHRGRRRAAAGADAVQTANSNHQDRSRKGEQRTRQKKKPVLAEPPWKCAILRRPVCGRVWCGDECCDMSARSTGESESATAGKGATSAEARFKSAVNARVGGCDGLRLLMTEAAVSQGRRREKKKKTTGNGNKRGGRAGRLTRKNGEGRRGTRRREKRNRRETVNWWQRNTGGGPSERAALGGAYIGVGRRDRRSLRRQVPRSSSNEQRG